MISSTNVSVLGIRFEDHVSLILCSRSRVMHCLPVTVAPQCNSCETGFVHVVFTCIRHRQGSIASHPVLMTHLGSFCSIFSLLLGRFAQASWWWLSYTLADWLMQSDCSAANAERACKFSAVSCHRPEEGKARLLTQLVQSRALRGFHPGCFRHWKDSPSCHVKMSKQTSSSPRWKTLWKVLTTF